MDNIFQKIKAILNIEINVPSLKNLHFLSDNKSKKVTYVDNSKTINININGLNSEEIPQIKKLIKEAVIEENYLVMEKDASKLLEDFKQEDKQEGIKNLVEYFKGKIPTTDIQILRAALYIKSLYTQRKPIGNLKADIIQKFGDRGRNITNLCSAGYFESLIKPLYEEMYRQPNFAVEKFMARYEVIVSQYPFAVFTSRNMTIENLKVEILAKMSINRQYGIKKLNIHGIGENNVRKIRDVLDELKKEFISIPDIDSGESYINATIYF